MKEGRCFFCKKRGHLARACPDKPSRGQGSKEEERAGPRARRARTDEWLFDFLTQRGWIK